MNIDANPGWIYGLGYAPMVGVLVTMCIAGWREENEDLALIRRRRQREVREEVEMMEKKRRDREEMDPKKELEKAIDEKERLAREEIYKMMA